MSIDPRSGCAVPKLYISTKDTVREMGLRGNSNRIFPLVATPSAIHVGFLCQLKSSTTYQWSRSQFVLSRNVKGIPVSLPWRMAYVLDVPIPIATTRMSGTSFPAISGHLGRCLGKCLGRCLDTVGRWAVAD